MPIYEVEIGGKTYEVDAPDEQSLTLAIRQMNTSQGAPGQQDGSFSLDNSSRAVARGALGIGSYLDEMDAATNATLAPIIDPLLPDSFQKLPGETWQERYDQALGIQRGKDKAFDTEHPYSSLGLKAVGAVGSAIAGARGARMAGASPEAVGTVLGMRGETMLPKMMSAGLSGAGIGAIQGFGAGEGDAYSRSRQSAIEAGTGAAIGAAMVPIASGVGKIAEWIAKKARGGTSDVFSGISPEAQKYISNNLGQPEKVGAYQSQLQKLGPDATLADVSPEWLGVARGAAAEPGMRDSIVTPLKNRADAANMRLNADLDANLGTPVIPSQVDRMLEESQRVIGQRYPEVMREARAVNSEPLANELDASVANLRGPEQRAVRDVRGYLDIPGTDVLDPNPQALHATREAIDGLLKTEQNPKVIFQLTNARNQVDELLANAVPQIKEVDAPFHELARQREALTQGRPILNNEASALRPQEVQDMLTEGANPQGLMVGPSGASLRMKQGVRAEIDRAVGTKANDVTALRNIVRGEGDWNRQKLGMLFGQENADRALNAIDRETIFADTANRVTRGSDTALGNNFSNFLRETKKAADVPADATIAGLGLKGGRKLIAGMLQKNAEAEAARYAGDIGKFSIANGAERDAALEALLNRGRQAVVDQQRTAMVRAMLQSAGLGGYSSLPVVRK